VTTLTAADLQPLQRRDDLTLEELIDTVDALVAKVAPEQTRYKVRERPDVRTVRYYTSRKLLPKPLSYDGGRARYGYLHVLRLLRIKQLQAARQTLAAIGPRLEGTTAADLEQALAIAPLRRPQVVKAPAFKSRRATEPAPAPEQAAPGPVLPAVAGRPIQRFTIDAGSVDLDTAALTDPHQRQRAADQLRALAEALLAGEPGAAPLMNDDEDD
jgi:DNA-binding transcriptional MerR regulator